MDVRGHRPKKRRDSLVGAMRAPQALDRRIGPPARLDQIVDAPLLVGDAQISVIAAPRPAGVGEHQDALLAAHEGVGLGLGGRGAAPLDHAAAVTADHPAAAPGDLGDLFCPERLEHRVQDAGHGRQASQVGDQLVAQAQGRLADDGRAIDHHRDHGDIAVLVLDRVHRHDREGAHQVVEHLILGRQIDGEVVPFLRRDLGEAPLHHRLIGRDHLDDRRAAGRQVLPDRRHEGGRFQARQQATKEAQLGAFEGRHHRRRRLAALGLALFGDPDRL